MTPVPDLYTNVHKGLRKVLFDLVLALGKAAPSPADSDRERELARNAVAFLRVHGVNEDAILLPPLETRAPELHRRWANSHHDVETQIETFERLIGDATSPVLHHAACRLVAQYLEHMHLEEVELEPQIRAVLTAEEAQGVGPQSMARTPEALRPFVLGNMLAAMPAVEAEALLGRLPPPLAEKLRAARG